MFRNRSRSPRDRRKDEPPARIKLPEKPEDGKIYDGRVANITNFGAFIQILGVEQKAEGLVHISQISQERVQSVGDVLTRGQAVKVKVG